MLGRENQITIDNYKSYFNNNLKLYKSKCITWNTFKYI